MHLAVVHRSSRTSDAEMFCVRPSALSSAMRYRVVPVAFSVFNNLGNLSTLATIPLLKSKAGFWNSSEIDCGCSAISSTRNRARRFSGNAASSACTMTLVRVSFSTLLAAILLTLSVGIQVLEATGQWDRTLQDSGDEAVIV